MTSHREQILAALHARLSALPATALRGEVLPERVPKEGLLILRDGEVKTAGGSVVAYERWREKQDRQILDEIEDYNRVDCISTEELRDWLFGIRPIGPWPTLAPDAGDKEVEEDADTQSLRNMLAGSGLPEARQDMLFNLGVFHSREVKPAQWAVFDSAAKDEDELLDDLDALGGLEASVPTAMHKAQYG